MDNPFGIVTTEQIRSGVATDEYFQRTREVLEHAGRNPHVVAEVTADQFPTGAFEVLAGVADLARLFEGRSVDVGAMAEGRLFDGGPVARIEGNYLAFAELETSLLGFCSQASGFATAALETRRAAPQTTLFSFGSRHLHPAIAGVVERSALTGGFDGFSHVAAGELLGRQASGTMPHALLLCFGEERLADAWIAFDEAAPAETPRIALCDTFYDEKTESLLAAETLGDALDGVRLDTTGSRRGDFRHICREVRWALDARGYEDVDIFLSGGITPETIRATRDVADGYGVGSYVTAADPVDFALDIVAVDGEPVAKRGKLGGVKQVYRTADGEHLVRLADGSGQRAGPPPADAEPLLEPLVRDGAIVRNDLDDIDAARKRCLADAEAVGFGGTV